MSDFQLTPPDLSTGYKPPANIFGDYHLHLDIPPPFQSYQRWVGLPGVGEPLLLWPKLNDLDDALHGPLSQFSGMWGASPSPAPGTASRLLELYLTDDIKKMIAEALTDKFATNLNVPGRTNIASGDPVTIGKLGLGSATEPPEAGRPTYDKVDQVVPGSAIPVGQGLGMLAFGKRFGFNALRDVDFSLIFDKDALFAGKYGLMFSGASIEPGISIPGTTGGKVKVVVGRDQVGGPAASIGLGFMW